MLLGWVCVGVFEEADGFKLGRYHSVAELGRGAAVRNLMQLSEHINIFAILDKLIDGWCERRALRPLQLLFRAYPSAIVHTDQFFGLLDAVKDVKGLCRSELTEEEIAMLIAVENNLEDRLKGYR